MHHKSLGRHVYTVAMAVGFSALAAPAFAQGECTCTLPMSTGVLGTVSQASAGVSILGAGAQSQAAAPGTQLRSGSELQTASAASASVDLGAGCRFSLRGSARMTITPLNQNLCVRVYDEQLSAALLAEGDPAAVAAVAAGAGLVISLGLLTAVSK